LVESYSSKGSDGKPCRQILLGFKQKEESADEELICTTRKRDHKLEKKKVTKIIVEPEPSRKS
jgi:hypothetical protein